jgi:hexokinase
MSKTVTREILGLQIMLEQELDPAKKARAEKKLAQLQGQHGPNQSMIDTVVMEAPEKTGHTPHGFHRPPTTRRPR